MRRSARSPIIANAPVSLLLAILPQLAPRAVTGQEEADTPLATEFRLLGARHNLGEPVRLEFTVRNTSTTTQHFTMDVDGSEFSFTGTHASGRPLEEHQFCRGTSWLLPIEIRPGATFRRHVVLSRFLTIDAPGAYVITCKARVFLLDDSKSDDKGRYVPAEHQLRLEMLPFDAEKARNRAEALSKMLDGPDPELRRHAVEALGYTDDSVAVPILIPALEHDDVRVRMGAVDSLATLSSKSAVQGLLHALRSRDEATRGRAAYAIGTVFKGTGDEKVLSRIYGLLGDTSRTVRCHAVNAINWIGGEIDMSRLRPLLRDPDTGVRAQVAVTLGIVGAGNKDAMELLHALLDDPNDLVRRGARQAITRLREKTPSREKSREPGTQDTAAVQSPALSVPERQHQPAPELMPPVASLSAPESAADQEPGGHEAITRSSGLPWMYLALAFAGAAAVGAVGVWLLFRRTAE